MKTILSAIIDAILSLFGIHHATPTAQHPNPPPVATSYSQDTASVAAAATPVNPFTDSVAATSSQTTQGANSYDATNNQFVKSANSSPTATVGAVTATSPVAVSSAFASNAQALTAASAPAVSSAFPSPNYVTQSQFDAGMSILSASLSQLLSNTSAFSQNSYSSNATPPLGGGSPTKCCASVSPERNRTPAPYRAPVPACNGGWVAG